MKGSSYREPLSSVKLVPVVPAVVERIKGGIDGFSVIGVAAVTCVEGIAPLNEDAEEEGTEGMRDEGLEAGAVSGAFCRPRLEKELAADGVRACMFRPPV